MLGLGVGWAWGGSGQHLELALSGETPEDFAMLSDTGGLKIVGSFKKRLTPAALGLEAA